MPLVNTHEIIKRIMSALFTAESRRLEAAKDKMILLNKEYYRNTPHDGFHYSGVPYDPSNLSRGKRLRVSLHFNLIDQMEEYLSDVRQIESDRKFISQILVALLMPCSSLQDIRDALPNCVIDTLDELKSYQRTRPEAFNIQDNPRLVRQYQKILPRIEFYATARLMY